MRVGFEQLLPPALYDSFGRQISLFVLYTLVGTALYLLFFYWFDQNGFLDVMRTAADALLPEGAKAWVYHRFPKLSSEFKDKS